MQMQRACEGAALPRIAGADAAVTSPNQRRKVRNILIEKAFDQLPLHRSFSAGAGIDAPNLGLRPDLFQDMKMQQVETHI